LLESAGEFLLSVRHRPNLFAHRSRPAAAIGCGRFSYWLASSITADRQYRVGDRR